MAQADGHGHHVVITCFFKNGAMRCVALMCCWFACVNATADNAVRQATVKQVIDGDTVVLESAETVRLAGVNAPEVARGKRPSQALAESARGYLEQKLLNRRVTVENAADPLDRYERTLAYLFVRDGQSVQAGLLEAGLASVIAIAPNDRYLAGYVAAEARARSLDLGIWGEPVYQPRAATSLKTNDRGYGFFHGRVQRIELGKRWFKFYLDRHFVIYVARTRWQQHFNYPPCALDQAAVVVRGWVTRKGKRWRTTISHPFMLERCVDSEGALCERRSTIN